MTGKHPTLFDLDDAGRDGRLASRLELASLRPRGDLGSIALDAGSEVGGAVAPVGCLGERLYVVNPFIAPAWAGLGGWGRLDLGHYTSGAGDFREAAAAVVALIAEGQSDELVCHSSVEAIEAHIAKTDAALERLRALVPPKVADVIPIKRKRVKP